LYSQEVPLELRQLRFFIGVAEAGSLLKASARLHIAQPALGQQIGALEGELGAQLFERSSRGMALTAAGRVFLEHAKVVLADADRARHAVREATALPSGDVAIGLPTTVALAVTVPLLALARERYPGLRLKVIESYSGYLREWLLAGRLDLALLFGDSADPSLNKRPLLDERLALVTSVAAKRVPRSLTLGELAHWPLVLPGQMHGLRRIIDDACAPLGLELDVVAEIDSLSSVKKAVEAGLGSTILSVASVAEEVAAGQLRASTIEDASMMRRVVCVTSVTRPLTPAGAALMGLTTELLHGMVRNGAWPARWIGAEANAPAAKAQKRTG
jgi:LysR family transcriptional regulator, nitrogen assimilation regulatory protein